MQPRYVEGQGGRVISLMVRGTQGKRKRGSERDRGAHV